MKLNRVSCKLIFEMLRIKNECSSDYCTVPMLISSLFAIRDGESFTNLFHIYFEKKLGIKFDVIDKALDEMISCSIGTDAQSKSLIHSSNITFSIPAEFSPDKTVLISTDDELTELFKHLEQFLKENDRSEITPDYFCVNLFEASSVSMRTFLKKLSANYMDAETFFERKKILSYEIVPYEISHFVVYSNPLYVGKTCSIVGREKELQDIYRNMLKPVKRNVLIYGFPGVGKTAIGELLKHNIANGLCPNHFKHFKIFEMSVKDFLLNCNDSQQANEAMNTLLNFLSGRDDDVILLIDEIQTILGKGNLFDTKKLDLSTTLKPILVRGDIRIVGMTTMSDYGSFESDQALSRRFAGIKIPEPKIKEVSKMITPVVRQIEKEKGILISDEMIEKAIWYAACFGFSKRNPDKSLDVIFGAFANAQLRNAFEIEIDDIFSVFEVSFKRWNGMSDQVKRNTAYHEAGHYVVNKLTNPGNMVVLAVSIYPTDEYLGINIIEIDDEVTPIHNKQYYLDEIACDLAGRIAEKMVSGDINSGASVDLDSATETAKNMIVEFGMSNGIGRNRAYLMDDFGSEEGAQEVDEEVSEIIDQVYKDCEKLLNENRDFLDAIAAGLLTRHILMKEELDAIWNDVERRRSQKAKNDKKRRTKKASSPHVVKIGRNLNSASRLLKKFHKQ